MSTAIVRFTTTPVTVSNLQVLDVGLVAPDKEVVDVLGFRSMRLTLKVYGIKAPAPGQLIILMETGMDLTDRRSFTSLGVFEPVGEAPIATQRVFTDLQRYVRWKVAMFRYQGQPETSPAVAEACFEIEGVLYS